MATLGQNYPTLLEISKEFGVNGEPLPVAEVLTGLVGAGHGERRAACGLQVLEEDLLDGLVMLHDQDPLAVEVDRRPGLVGSGAAAAADVG